MIKRTEIFDLLPRPVCSKPLYGLIGLEKALNLSNIETTFNKLGEVNVDVSNICHRLVYLEPDKDEWGFVVPRIASDFIRCQIQYVLSSLDIEYHRNMAVGAYASNDSVLYDVAYGNFSQLVLSEMFATSFEVRQWFPYERRASLVNRVEFSQSMIKGVTYFRSPSFREIVVEEERYYAPREGTRFPFIGGCKVTNYTLFGSSDGKESAEERKGLIGFRMVTATEHAINPGKVFENFLKKGDGMSRPLLIFVVPEEVFPGFSPSLPNETIGRLNEIDIFIMKLPLRLRLPEPTVPSGTMGSQRTYEPKDSILTSQH
jgi:hypothetical protein